MRPTGSTTRTSRARSIRRSRSHRRWRACVRRCSRSSGLLDWRIDTGLLAALADRRPDWSLALVGPPHADLGALAARPNVHLLGRLPYARLPAVLKGCAVGLVPFVVNEYTRHIDPVKLREYLSAGLPVVATDAARGGRDRCRPAGSSRGVDELVVAVEAALRDGSPEERRRRSAAMASETWEARVEALGAHLIARPWRRVAADAIGARRRRRRHGRRLSASRRNRSGSASSVRARSPGCTSTP